MIKKVELHLHLDGSVKEETANKILNQKCDLKAKDKCNDLNEYLEKFEIPSIILQTKENLKLVAYELANDLKKDNVIYAEIRFAPLKHIKEGLSLDEVINSVLEGLSKVDIKTNLILCMMRGDSIEDNKKVVDLAHKYSCAIDLAGAEAVFKTSLYEELFKYAKSLNVPFTIHAGEADGYDSIKDAINFGATRLGHGIKIIDYPDLIELAKEKNITLEICPTSNVQTNAINEYKDHPIKKLYDMGVKVCINTDNRTVSNITLEEEYQKLKDAFNFSDEDFMNMNINAINASFTNDKEILIKQLRGE
jgi:adenosine deaminase